MTNTELAIMRLILDSMQEICNGHDCANCQMASKKHDCLKILVKNIIKKSEDERNSNNDRN